MNGRIGALLILYDGTYVLGGAQGGIWTFDGTQWTPRSDGLPSLAIGALAVAPSAPNVLYAGTGEGAMSGDSYAGNGVMKSTDRGRVLDACLGGLLRRCLDLTSSRRPRERQSPLCCRVAWPRRSPSRFANSAFSLWDLGVKRRWSDVETAA